MAKKKTASKPKARPASRDKRPKQPPLPGMDVSIPGEQMLIELAEKAREKTAEWQAVGVEMRDMRLAVIAKMHHMKIKTFTRGDLSIELVETKERVKIITPKTQGSEAEATSADPDADHPDPDATIGGESAEEAS